MTKKKSIVATSLTINDVVEEDMAEDSFNDNAVGLLNEAVADAASSLLKVAVEALITSGVLIDYSDPKSPVFRVGHREHVMAAYAANPAQAKRDYEYELTVILAADANALG